jgi:chloramphenicol 3-O-phosphotransferase
MIGRGIRVWIVSILVTGIFLGISCIDSNADGNKQDVGVCSSAVQPGRIIFVTGSCSAGKSSMANVIAQKLDAKSFAFDEYVMPEILKKFITKHYGKFVAFFVSGFVMRNFFTAIDFLSEKKKYAFQLKFYNDLREGMAIEPTRKMYREAKRVALTGRNVVIESPLYLWNGVDFLQCLDEFNGVPVTYTLAYCPWNTLVDRIKHRNIVAKKKNRRELNWVLVNFIDNFEISPKNQGKHSLEYVSGGDVHRVIAEYVKPQYKKNKLRIVAETQQVVLKAIPQDIHYYVCPRFNYDLTINTTQHTPEQGAAVVLDYVHKNEIR